MAYDVFISFKNSDANGKPTKESATAKKLYDYLTGKGLRVFFSNVELEFTGKAQYTKVIDEALDSSTFLIAVGSSHDNFNSQWVRYEWESFLNDIRSGIKPNAEVFVVCAAGMKVPQLPRALRQQQAFDASDGSAFERLYNFIHNAGGADTGRAEAPAGSEPDSGKPPSTPRAPKDGQGGKGGASPRKPKWLIPAILGVVAVALVLALVFILPRLTQEPAFYTPEPAMTDTSAPKPAETVAAGVSGDIAAAPQPTARPDTAEGVWPKSSNEKTFAIAYPAGAVQVPADAARFTPRGIATIKTTDGQTLKAIANTLLFTDVSGTVKDGLFINEGNQNPILFADIKSFKVTKTEGDFGYSFQLDIKTGSGSTQLTTQNGIYSRLLCMLSDGSQEGQILRLDYIDEVTLDWAATPAVQEYVLVTRENGASALVPQNILYTKRSQGLDGYSFAFGLQLNSGTTVEFRRVQQVSVSRTFNYQQDSDASTYPATDVEIKLKTGDILQEELVISYYGSGSLEYPSALGVTSLYSGDWVTIQYVGAVQ